MRKTLIFAIMMPMLLMLAACGSQMTAKPVSKQTAPKTPTGAAVTEPAPEPEEQPKTTAAEAIKELRSQQQQTTATTTTKQGSTGMPPAPEGLTGKDALKARTKALYSKGTTAGKIEADKEFGPRHNK